MKVFTVFVPLYGCELLNLINKHAKLHIIQSSHFFIKMVIVKGFDLFCNEISGKQVR